MNTNALLLIMITTLLLSSIAIIVPVRAVPADSMWIEPSSLSFNVNTTSVGYKFNVTVWLNMTTPANSWQFYLIYNKNHLNVTRCDYTGSGKSLWSDAFPTNPVEPTFGAHNGTFDYVLHAEVLKSAANQTGSGSLAWVEFEIMSAPGAGETFSSDLRLDVIGPFNSYVLDASLNPMTVSYEKTTYEYVGLPAPPRVGSWLEVLPDTITLTKPAVFNVSVYIRDVNASSRLIAAQFGLTYNSTFIAPMNVTPGPFMSNASWATHGTFPTWAFDEGNTLYGELILPNATGDWDLPEFPSGDGLLATVTFRTLVHEAASFSISAEPVFGQYFLDADTNYLPFSNATACTYTYDPLPKPMLTVNPSLYTASHVGEQFNIEVTLSGLVEDWRLTFVEFKLMWKENVLTLMNGTEGDFLRSFGNTTMMHEDGSNYTKGNITLTPTSVYPSGGGVLVTFRFNVTSTPGRCPLTLNDTRLLDFEGKEVLFDVQHGYYRLYERLIHPIVWGDLTYNVETLSSASVTPVPMAFIQSHAMLGFNITDEEGTVGFVNITIPKDLLKADPAEWLVLVGGQSIAPIVSENATHTMLSLNVSLSTKSVYILGTSAVPEFSLNTVLMLFFALTLIGFACVRSFRAKKHGLLSHLKQ
jgi:hypothetical protein